MSRAASGVTVRLLTSDYPDLAKGNYQLCVEDQCQQGGFHPASLLSASDVLPDGWSTQKVTVRLRITAPGAHAPGVDERMTTTLKRADITCMGTSYTALLALTPAGGLSESVPSTGPWDPKNAARPPVHPNGSPMDDASQATTGATPVGPSP